MFPRVRGTCNRWISGVMCVIIVGYLLLVLQSKNVATELYRNLGFLVFGFDALVIPNASERSFNIFEYINAGNTCFVEDLSLKNVPEVDAFIFSLAWATGTTFQHIAKNLVKFYSKNVKRITAASDQWTESANANCTYEVNMYGLETDSSIKYGGDVGLLNITESCPPQYVHRGGASFRVEIGGTHTVDVCKVQDHFNGSYTGICPCFHDKDFNISVTLMFSNFSAYLIRQIKSQQKLIWSQEYQSLSQKLTYGTQEISFYNHNVEKIINSGHWTKSVNGSYQWKTPGGVLHSYSSHDNQRCLQGLGPLEVTGDSHGRYLFSYLLLQRDGAFNHIPKNVDSQRVGDWEYTRTSSDMRSRLLLLTKRICKSSKVADVRRDSEGILPKTVLMTYGAWPTCRKHYIHGFFQKMTSLKQAVVGLSAEDVRLVWLPTPPMHGSYPYDNEESRNNFILPVINHVMYTAFRPYSVEIFDWYKVMISRNKDHMSNACKIHLFCVYPHAIVGEIGPNVGDMIIRYLCEHNKK